MASTSSTASRFRAFLSHSSVDKRFVETTARRLGRRRVNFDIWAFETGESFIQAIRKAIAGSDFFVLFASRESLKSLWVKFEIQEAEELLRLEVLRSSAVLIIDPAVKHSDLPPWMQRALVTSVTQPAQAAHVIEAGLNRIRGIKEQPLFIGREELLKEFSEKLIPEHGQQPPHIVIAGGLSGVGRKTFLRRGFADFLSLSFAPIFILQPSDDLEMLHFQLLDELSETDSRSEREAAIEKFRKVDAQKRADLLAQMLLSAAQGNFAPTIIDEGALFDADGTYTSEARLLLSAIHKYPNLFVALVHGRRPAHSDVDLHHLGAIYMRVPPLNLVSTKRLLVQSARASNISLEAHQIDDLSTYLDGYPPAVHLAVSMAKEYGAAVLLADKTTLVDFKIHTFAKILEKLKLDVIDWTILRVLAANGVLPLEAISTITQSPLDVVVQTLRKLIDYNLALPVENDFQLAAPIRSAVEALKGPFTPEEQTRFAARLRAAYWTEPHAKVPPVEVINATVSAVLRSANVDAGLAEFGSLIMPSVMYRVAKEHYDSGGEKGWERAQPMLTRIIELVPHHKASLILLFKTNVRLNQWQSAEEVLSRIDSHGYIERHYLRGFLSWKRDDLGQAVSHFRNALAVGHHAVEVYHGLASCLFLQQNLKEAEKVLAKGLQGRRRPNFVLWDLAAQIAILRGQYDKAEQILDELKRLDEGEDYYYRLATLLSAQKRFHEALEYARRAAAGRRRRFEVLAHLADILIEVGSFDEARQQIDSLDESYRIGTLRHDVRVGLRCKLYLRMNEWRPAEAIWREIHEKNRPIHQALLAEVLRQKIVDVTTTPGQRAIAEQQLESMGEQQSLFALQEDADIDAIGEEEVESS